jgi:hypothetical protein
VTSRLKILIDNLYDVFSAYPGTQDMQGSPLYGELAAWNKELFSRPLKELSAAQLSRFTGKAMTTWGEADDYKHFLPRIFELTAQLDTPYEVWIAFGKLEYGNWNTWPEKEQVAIHEYMLALWQNLLLDDSEKAEWVFMEYFSSIVNFYPRFADILDIWEKETGDTATKHLVNLIFDQRENIFDQKSIPGFYKKQDHAAELVDWLLSDKIIRRLEKSIFHCQR